MTLTVCSDDGREIEREDGPLLLQTAPHDDLVTHVLGVDDESVKVDVVTRERVRRPRLALVRRVLDDLWVRLLGYSDEQRPLVGDLVVMGTFQRLQTESRSNSCACIDTSGQIY